MAFAYLQGKAALFPFCWFFSTDHKFEYMCHNLISIVHWKAQDPKATYAYMQAEWITKH